MEQSDYRAKTITSDYIESLFAVEDESLKQVRNTAPSSGRHMMISAEDGRFLAMLAQMINAKRILEIGTFVGYSTLWLAQALPEDGKVITIEKDTDIHRVAEQNFINSELDNKIIALNIDGGKLAESAVVMDNAKYDMIFIDANKSGYLDYFHFADQNIADQGIIVLDNALFHGEVADFNNNVPSKAAIAIREVNQYIANHPKYFSTIIRSSDGMLIAKKQFGSCQSKKAKMR